MGICNVASLDEEHLKRVSIEMETIFASPIEGLLVEAEEPPLGIGRRKGIIHCPLELKDLTSNPAYDSTQCSQSEQLFNQKK